MRTANSFKNLATSIGITLVMTLLGFFTRKIFVDEIGVEYLGLNGLLQNILGLMTLLEGGFATSVVYNLYKPLAEDNRPLIIGLIQLYRKVYRYIAIGVILCGIAIYPFIGYFISDFSDMKDVGIIYFIFLFNSTIQYFTAYKWSLINSSQQAYKLATINLTYQIGLNLGKLAILYYTQNYIIYLVVEALFGIGLNFAIVKKANKLFPYIVGAERHSVPTNVKNNIITNMKALFLHSLGGYFMHSTDNIVMSAYIGVGIVGLYSNYTLITTTLRGFTNQILNSFSESVGNLIASESAEHSYYIFKTILFVNFLVASAPVVILSTTMQPLVQWWIGAEYELSKATLAVILFNFYIDSMRSSALTFKVKSGIFVKDRFTPLIQGVINLLLSLLFVRIWGLTGVLAATGISILSIGFWQWPRLIYKYTFKKNVKAYFLRYLKYSSVFLLVIIISNILCHLVPQINSFVNLIVNASITLTVMSSIYFIAFRDTEEYKSILDHIRIGILSKFRHQA